jgi:hypothetical protein
MISKLICWWKDCGLPGSLNVLGLDHRERYKDALKFLNYNHWVSFSEWRGDLGGVVWVWLLCLLFPVSFGVWVGLWVGTHCTHNTFHLLSVESRYGEIGWVGSCLGWGGCSWRGWLVTSVFVSNLSLLIKIQFFLGFSRMPMLLYMFIVLLLVICYWFWTIIATWADGDLRFVCMGNLRNSLGVIRKEYAFGLIGMLNLLYHCVFLQKHTNLLGPAFESCSFIAKCLFSILFESVFGLFVWKWGLNEYGLKVNSCEKMDFWKHVCLLWKWDYSERWIQLDWLWRMMTMLRKYIKSLSSNGLWRSFSRLRKQSESSSLFGLRRSFSKPRRQPDRLSLIGLRRSFSKFQRQYKRSSLIGLRRRFFKLRRQYKRSSLIGLRRRFSRLRRQTKSSSLNGLRRNLFTLRRQSKNMRAWRRFIRLRWQRVLGFIGPRWNRNIRSWRSPNYKMLNGPWEKNPLLWRHLKSLNLDGLWRKNEMSWWILNVVGLLFVSNECLISQRPDGRGYITKKEAVWSGPVVSTKWAEVFIRIWTIIVYLMILIWLKVVWSLNWIIKSRMVVWTWALDGRTECLVKYGYILGLGLDNIWQRLSWARNPYSWIWCGPIMNLTDSVWAFKSNNAWSLIAYMRALKWKSMFYLDEWIRTCVAWVWNDKEYIIEMGLDGRSNCLTYSWAWIYTITQWCGLIGVIVYPLINWIWAVYKSFCIWVGYCCDRYYGPAYSSHLFRAHLFCHVGFYHFHFRIFCCCFFLELVFSLGLYPGNTNCLSL